jgi:glycosyltransferase involved in cell wall biosynthesis
MLQARQVPFAVDAANSPVPPPARDVVIVNHSWPPEVAATGQLAHDVARCLVVDGVGVQVICGAGGRPEDGSGIEIRCTGPKEDSTRPAIERVARWFVFMCMAGWRLRGLQPDATVLCTTSPPFLPVALTLLDRRARRRRVIWCMDVHPEALVAAGIIRGAGLVDRVLRALDGWAMRRADRVITLCETMRDTIVARGVPADRIQVVPPWATVEFVGESEATTLRTDLGFGNRLVVSYAGNLGVGHDCETMLQAMHATASDRRIGWLISGGGVGHVRIAREARTSGWFHVRTSGFVPRARLATWLGLAHVHLVCLDPAFEGVMFPSKFSAAIASGRPVILIGSPEGEIGRLILEHDIGCVIRPGDAAGLLETIRLLLQDPASARARGERARQLFESRFDGTCNVRQLVSVLMT